MSDDERETKPFKFVTAGKNLLTSTPPHPTDQPDVTVSTPVSPTSTRPSTAGKTTLITTSASTPRARTSSPAASSSLPTDLCAPAAGTSDGTSSASLVTSLLSWTFKSANLTGCIWLDKH